MSSAEVNVGRAGAWSKAEGFVGYQGEWVPIAGGGGGGGGGEVGGLASAGLLTAWGRGIMIFGNSGSTNRRQAWHRIGTRWFHLRGQSMWSWAPEDDTTAWRTEANNPHGGTPTLALVLDGKLVIVNGMSRSSFDPATRAWSSTTAIPGLNTGDTDDRLVMRSPSGRIYIMRAIGTSDVLRHWAPGESDWTTVTAPTALGFRCFCLQGERIYATEQTGFPSCSILRSDDQGRTWTVMSTATMNPPEPLWPGDEHVYLYSTNAAPAGIGLGVNRLNPDATTWTLIGAISGGMGGPRFFQDLETGQLWTTWNDNTNQVSWAVPWEAVP